MMISEPAFPLQTVLVTCRGRGKNIVGVLKTQDNIITIGWHMPVSIDPPLYAISVGKNRHSLELIRTGGVFCVNFMPILNEKEVLYCGRVSGINTDKFKETGFHRGNSERIDCPRIKEADGHIECEVVQEIELGDHVLFVGKALQLDFKNNRKRIFHLGADKFTTTEF